MQLWCVALAARTSYRERQLGVHSRLMVTKMLSRSIRSSSWRVIHLAPNASFVSQTASRTLNDKPSVAHERKARARVLESFCPFLIRKHWR